MASYWRSALTKAKAGGARILSTSSSSSSSSSSSVSASPSCDCEPPTLFHESTAQNNQKQNHQQAPAPTQEPEREREQEEQLNSVTPKDQNDQSTMSSQETKAPATTAASMEDEQAIDSKLVIDQPNDPAAASKQEQSPEHQQQERQQLDPVHTQNRVTEALELEQSSPASSCNGELLNVETSPTRPLDATRGRCIVEFSLSSPTDVVQRPANVEPGSSASNLPDVAKTIDVLLQPDAFGFGLIIGLEETHQALVIQSFRRRDPTDSGPAERCGQLQVGDVLVSIDGEPIHSLGHLHSKLARVQQTQQQHSTEFVLFRFQRHPSPSAARAMVNATRVDSPKSHPTIHKDRAQQHTGFLSSLALDDLLSNPSQVAFLVRQLVTTNESLKNQLVETRLKLAERTRQLKELQTEFHRSDMESKRTTSASPVASLPFRRISSNSNTKRPILTLTAKEEQLLETAIAQEHLRIAGQLTEQYEIEKARLTKKFRAELHAFQEQMIKKQDMLEKGFAAAIEYLTSRSKPHRQNPSDSIERLIEESSPKSSSRNGDGDEFENDDCRCHTLLHLRRELADHAKYHHMQRRTHNHAPKPVEHPTACEALDEASARCEQEEDPTTEPASCVACVLLEEVKALIHHQDWSNEDECDGECTTCQCTTRKTPTTNEMEDIRQFLQEYKALQSKRAVGFVDHHHHPLLPASSPPTTP